MRKWDRERERDGEETRVEVRPMIDEDRPVGPTYRQQKNKTTTIKTVCWRTEEPTKTSSWDFSIIISALTCKRNLYIRIWVLESGAISSYNPKLYYSLRPSLSTSFVIKAKASSHYTLNWSIVFLVRSGMEGGWGGRGDQPRNFLCEYNACFKVNIRILLNFVPKAYT